MAHARSSELKLIWQELICLHEHRIALRGVSDEKQAIEEQQKGGEGDAVSLAGFAFIGAENLKLCQHPLVGNSPSAAYTLFLCSEDAMNEQPTDKAILLQRFHAGIRAHVEQCVTWFGCKAFLLVNRGEEALLPYEVGERYPLGKCGRSSFAANQVKAIIRLIGANLDAEMAYNTIIAGIKNFCRTKRLEKIKILNTSQLFTHHPSETKKEKVVQKCRCRCVIM
jgi:hypothetical protein